MDLWRFCSLSPAWTRFWVVIECLFEFWLVVWVLKKWYCYCYFVGRFVYGSLYEFRNLEFDTVLVCEYVILEILVDECSSYSWIFFCCFWWFEYEKCKKIDGLGFVVVTVAAVSQCQSVYSAQAFNDVFIAVQSKVCMYYAGEVSLLWLGPMYPAAWIRLGLKRTLLD